MKKILVAFDVDGTLRSNTTADLQPNVRIVEMLKTFSTFKNVRLQVWSNRGQEYAQEIIDKFELPKCYAASKIDPETWAFGKPIIAFDDQHSFELAVINLIVREK